jgi:hypothetical protein
MRLLNCLSFTGTLAKLILDPPPSLTPSPVPRNRRLSSRPTQARPVLNRQLLRNGALPIRLRLLIRPHRSSCVRADKVPPTTQLPTKALAAYLRIVRRVQTAINALVREEEDGDGDRVDWPGDPAAGLYSHLDADR